MEPRVEQLWPGAGHNLAIYTDRKNIFNPTIAINVNINERLSRESMLLNQFSFYPSHAHWIAPTICWLLEIFNQNPMDILSLFNFSNVLWRLDVVQFFVRIFVLSVVKKVWLYHGPRGGQLCPLTARPRLATNTNWAARWGLRPGYFVRGNLDNDM